jgi:hypothetical protein
MSSMPSQSVQRRPWFAPRHGDERPLSALPRPVFVALAVALAAQVATRALAPGPTARAVDLDLPPSTASLRVVAAGEAVPLAQALTLRLQAFDNQPGVSLPFASLDYARVEAWLGTLLDLDPPGQTPLLMATHLYGAVAIRPDLQRRMFAFVARRFVADPDRRWPWLAHAAVMARHRLHDLPLALAYADLLRDHATGAGVPAWARQMHIFLREDMGEVDAARVLLGGLIDSGTVMDSHELTFLLQRLEAMGGRPAAEKSSPAPPR